MNVIERLRDEFNMKTKKLTIRVHNFDKKDDVIYRTKERILIVTDVDPTYVIKTMGPYLYKYSDDILSDDEKFMNHDYAEDLTECVEGDPAPILVPKLKLLWRSLDDIGKKELITLVRDLLEIYLDYATLEGDMSKDDKTLLEKEIERRIVERQSVKKKKRTK